jgi:hypothetical protein
MGVLGAKHIAFRTPDPVRLRAFLRRADGRRLEVTYDNPGVYWLE